MLGYKFKGLTAVNRRRDRRIPVSVPATANGLPVMLKDISLGGLAFITKRSRHAIGDEVLIQLDLSDLGRVKIGASIVRVQGKNEYGVAFIGLSADAFRLIETLELGKYRRRLQRVA